LKLGEFWLTQLLKVSQSNLNPSLEIQLQTWDSWLFQNGIHLTIWILKVIWANLSSCWMKIEAWDLIHEFLSYEKFKIESTWWLQFSKVEV
jgi:hypothetical protein